MKSYLFGAVSVLSLLAAGSASAQINEESSGWYLRGNAGYGIHADPDLDGGVDSSFHGNGLQSEGGVAYSLGAGYDFGEHWRVEVDGDSLNTNLGSVSQTPGSNASLTTESVMLNALYDFDGFGKLEPYVGAGVGYVRGNANVASHDFINDLGNLQRNPTCVGARTAGDISTCDVSDSDSGFGWQLLAGLGYNITDKLSWDTHYTYLNAPDFDLDGTITNFATGESAPLSAELNNVAAHTVMTGLRYRFGQDRPAPRVVERVVPQPTFRCWDGNLVFNSGQCAPQPERVVEAPRVQTFVCWDGVTTVTDTSQCPAQPVLVTCPDGSQVSDINFCPRVSQESIADLCGEQYRQEIIYYDFNKGQSAETRNTINRILDIGQFCDVQNIRVVGHTDTSGAASYNLALSKRRATDALNELVRDGVSRNLITAEGKGETEPFVQTGDGVKEPLNRRTEVLLTLGSTGARSFN